MTDPDPDNEASFHVLVVDSTHVAVEEPKRTILDAVQRAKFPEDVVFGVKLALEEALCNAVKHGNECCPDKSVTIRYAVTPQQIVIIVRDEGPGFRPEDIPDPTTPEHLSMPSGRGILLMRAYMDKVEFRDRGREVYFMKRRP